jgi:hypothetical protein
MFYIDAIQWCWWDIKPLGEKALKDIELESFSEFIKNEKQSLAIVMRNEFQNMCLKLANQSDLMNRNSILEDSFKTLSKRMPESIGTQSLISKLRSKLGYKSIYAYIIIIIFHLIGCSISGKEYLWHFSPGTTRTIENILFYIPNDVLLILVYLGIVKEHKKNHKNAIESQSNNKDK